MSAGLIQHYSSGVYKYKTNIPTLQDDIRCVNASAGITYDYLLCGSL
jgi:hypothetical protein